MERSLPFFTMKMLKALLTLWALPLALALRLMTRLGLLRVREVYSSRIGHFIADTIEQIGDERSASGRRLHATCLTSWDDANPEWRLICKSHLPLRGPWLSIIAKWDRVLPGTRGVQTSSKLASRDINGYCDRGLVEIRWSESQVARGYEWLSSYGWKAGEPIFCFLIRDEAYMKWASTHHQSLQAPKQIADHRYRNTDIRDYVPSFEYLLDQGSWVIRMGSVAEAPVPIRRTRLIDYPFSTGRTPLLDLWPFSVADGVVSTGSGPDVLSLPFGTPLLLVNYAPITHLITFASVMHAPQVAIDPTSGRELTLEEQLLLQINPHDSNAQTRMGLRHLRSSEIRSSVQEFWNAIRSGQMPTRTATENQRTFWEIYEQWASRSSLHGYQCDRSTISSSWLQARTPDYLK